MIEGVIEMDPHWATIRDTKAAIFALEQECKTDNLAILRLAHELADVRKQLLDRKELLEKRRQAIRRRKETLALLGEAGNR